MGEHRLGKDLNISLDNKLSAFDKETRTLQRTIEQVPEEDQQVERDLLTLQTVTNGYRDSVKALEELFSSDRWGETQETALKVRDIATDVLKSAESKIVELSKMSRRENEMSAPLHDKSRCTSHSPSMKSNRSSNSSLIASKAKAAAEKQQAEYDLMIAEKENEIQLREAEEIKRSMAMKAQDEHEMAVLKARQRAAMATATINAIEKSLCEENLSHRHEKSSYSEENRTQEWIQDQQKYFNLRNRKTRETKISNYEEMKNNTLPSVNGEEPIRVQDCMLAVAETNRQLTASLARQQLPKCHPDVFGGDFAMFHAWKKAFKAMIHDADISPENKMNYLHKYTVGEPQKLVDNFRKRVDKNQSVVVRNLWLEMERRFGNMAALPTLCYNASKTPHTLVKTMQRNYKISQICVITLWIRWVNSLVSIVLTIRT